MFNASPPQKKKLKQLAITDLLKPSSSSANSKSTNLSRLQQKRFALKKFQGKTSGSNTVCAVQERNKMGEQSSSGQVKNLQATESRLLDELKSCESDSMKETMKNDSTLKGDDSSQSLQKTLSESNSYDWFNGDDKPSEESLGASQQVDDVTSNHSDSMILEGSCDTKTDSNQSNEQRETELGTPFEDLNRVWLDPPELQASQNHWVLFQGSFDDKLPPAPFDHPYTDRWDANHVRLPCSPKNLYAVDTPGGKTLSERWEMIEASLLMNLTSSIDIEESILVYNSRYSQTWSFRSLHTFFTNFVDQDYTRKFFDTTLPGMVNLALQLPTLFPKPLPMCSRHRSCKVTLTQQQVACLLCNAFFCTFPRRNSHHRESEYANFPMINFSGILQGGGRREEANLHKIRTLLHYFERVTENMPTGTITYERRCMDNFPKWSQSPCTMGRLHISCDGMIEDAQGLLQVDFANKYIGGGVLRTGLVQEEIRFCICPELIASMLFMEKMDDNECIIITGAEQFSTYAGYAETYKWTGDHVDATDRDTWGRRKTQIVAIDATKYNRWANQYTPTSIVRELNKAYCGFHCDDPEAAPAIATGNWGCGAFGGDPVLKSIIQLMAASTCGRDLCYFTFGDEKLMHEIFDVYSFIVEKKLRICDLWSTICNYNRDVVQIAGKKTKAKESLARYLKRRHQEYDQSTDESS